MLELIKTIHLIAGTMILGLSIASIWYVRSSIRQNDAVVLRYALLVSFIYDAIMLFAIIFQYISGFILSNLLQIPHHTPWLMMAYLVFTIVVLCCLASFVIRMINYKKVRVSKSFLYPKMLYTLHIFMIVLFMIIIHDAITQSTYLGFLLKGW